MKNRFLQVLPPILIVNFLSFLKSYFVFNGNTHIFIFYMCLLYALHWLPTVVSAELACLPSPQ